MVRGGRLYYLIGGLGYFPGLEGQRMALAVVARLGACA